MNKVKYCPNCGNSGIDINNKPCSCRFNVETFYEGASSIDIPEQFRGVKFSKFLLPADMSVEYCEYMQKLHDDIVSNEMRNHNIVLCSPTGKGKSILAYSAIEALFRRDYQTFPLFDILELKRILLDIDLNRKPFYEVEHPEYLYTAPYVFIKIPRLCNWEVFDTMLIIIDRRVRRGNSTIFLYDGVWSSIANNDKYALLTNIVGDGTGNTIDVKTWYPKDNETARANDES